jgi:tetratricopeptide (TPR) repeat protein
MGVLRQFLSLFSGGTDGDRLKKGIDEAKAGRPEAAIVIYDRLVASSADADLRAQALFNRALAYSALGDDIQSENDLRSVMALNQASESVRNAAREKMARVQARVRRTQNRSQLAP